VDKRPVTSSYTVGLPNGNTMAATHTALLPDNGVLPPLSTLARRAHVFPSMTNNPLLSIGQFCDNGYNATFTSDDVLLSKQGQTFPIGTRNPINGLWTVDLNPTATTSLGPPNMLITFSLPLVNSAQAMKTLPSRMFQPCHQNLDISYRCWLLYNMAWTYLCPRLQTPSQIGRNCQRPLAHGPKKCPIHQDEHPPIQHRTIYYDHVGTLR
jgi:hypothetical protein